MGRRAFPIEAEGRLADFDPRQSEGCFVSLITVLAIHVLPIFMAIHPQQGGELLQSECMTCRAAVHSAHGCWFVPRSSRVVIFVARIHPSCRPRPFHRVGNLSASGYADTGGDPSTDRGRRSFLVLSFTLFASDFHQSWPLQLFHRPSQYRWRAYSIA